MGFYEPISTITSGALAQSQLWTQDFSPVLIIVVGLAAAGFVVGIFRGLF